MTTRLVQIFCEIWQIDGTLGQCRNDKLNVIADQFHNWQGKPSGSDGYRTAEVSLGGIDTNEVSQKTFESIKAPGIYFVSECLGVTGHLRGHNFQWAWSSEFCAGQTV